MMEQQRTSISEMLVVLLRVFLGVVFIFASIDKIADPSAFASSILNYKIFPANLALLIATILPWMELLCGLALLSGILVRGSALLTLTMLVLFTVLVSVAVMRGLDISCGCFTQDPSASRVGWMKVGENLLLILMNILVLRTPARRFSLEGFIQDRAQQSGNL